MFGIGQQKPHHYLEMARVAWENRDELPFAWRILRDGVCDGCALGTSGLSDWTIPGTHLCMVRLELMRLNTAPALDPAVLGDVASLAGAVVAGAARRSAGCPSRCCAVAASAGSAAISWDEALDRSPRELRATDPAARRLLPDLARHHQRGLLRGAEGRALPRHATTSTTRRGSATRRRPSAMKATLGYGASTCSYTDWLDADLIVFFGSNVANNQPVTTKYLHHAKQNAARRSPSSTRIASRGSTRYWVPSIAESALVRDRARR